MLPTTLIRKLMYSYISENNFVPSNQIIFPTGYTLNIPSYQDIRQFLLPWLTIVKIELVFSLASLLVCVIMGHGATIILLVTGMFIHLRK